MMGRRSEGTSLACSVQQTGKSNPIYALCEVASTEYGSIFRDMRRMKISHYGFHSHLSGSPTKLFWAFKVSIIPRLSGISEIHCDNNTSESRIAAGACIYFADIKYANVNEYSDAFDKIL